MKNWMKCHMDAVRCAYLCLLAVYGLLREVLVLSEFLGNSIFTFGFLGLGVLLVAWDLLEDREWLRKPAVKIIAIFFAASVLSVLLNLRYEFLSNIKGLCWMFLYGFLLFPQGDRIRRREKNRMRPVLYTVVAVTAVLVLVSLPMYFWDVDYVYSTGNVEGLLSNSGFSHRFIRLWGVFQEANRGACYVFAAMLMGGYLFATTKKVAARILLGVAELLMYTFIALTLSRTAQVAILAVLGWIAFYAAFTKLGGKRLHKVLLSAGCAVLAVAVGFFLNEGVVSGIPYVKQAVRHHTTWEQNRAVHQGYDYLYRTAGLNIVSGYWNEAEQDPTDAPDAEVELEELDRTDDKDDISNGRIERWTDGLTIFTKSPLWGTSPRGTVAFAKEHCPDTVIAKYDKVVHNGFLETLVGTGILGFVPMMLLMVLAAGCILVALQKQTWSWERLLYSSILLLLVIAGFLTSDLFFILSFGGVWFWFAMGYVIEKKAKN